MKARSFLLPALLLGSIVMGAEEPSAEAQVRRVALFKNGYSWVQLRAKLPDADHAQITGMPNAVLGTIWWDTASGVRLLEGKSEEVDVNSVGYDFAALLHANEGKQVELTLKKEGQVEGTILPQARSEAPGGSFIQPQEPGPDVAPKIVLLQTEDGVQALKAEEVAGVSFAEGEVPQMPTQKVKINIVTAQLDKPRPGTELSFGCLSWGMSWLPEYALELGENGTAKLICRANIINEMTDLQDAELQLVSGFPAFGEAVVESPINRDVKLREFLKSLGMLSAEASSLMTQNARVRAYAVPASGRSYDGEEGVEQDDGSKQVEDLFYYTLPHVTCERGKSILREIFSCEVPFSHVYTCRVPNQSMLENLSRHGEPVVDVWHCVRLTNTDKHAWSTGIVTCTAGGQLVARSTLNFAAPGGETLLRLNKTLQADVLCSEKFVKREHRKTSASDPGDSERSASKGLSSISTRSAESESAETVRTVSIYRGVVTFKNASDRTMDVKLTKEVEGLVTTADRDGKITTSPSYSGDPRSVITWRVTVQPGESMDFAYSYERENHTNH